MNTAGVLLDAVMLFGILLVADLIYLSYRIRRLEKQRFMPCPHCGAANISGSAFCARCGKTP